METINKSIFKGIAGARGANPTMAIIHNDYGAMTPEAYAEWLQRRYDRGDSELGFAHYYGNRHAMLRCEDTFMRAYHAGNATGNTWALGYEVCESYDEQYVKVDDATFILNENAVLKQVAEDFHFYGLKPNRQTIRLHKEFADTSCPHRSWKLHGRSVNSVKDYFIAKVKHYMSLGKTVEEINLNENKKPVKVEVEERMIMLSNFRNANVYKIPNFDGEYVNTKSKKSSIKASFYAYGEHDKEGNSVWLLIDKGTKYEGYIHSNNFLSIRSNEIYQEKK
ncbi:N-acetylmuramoyl-L-alanine amidase [Jeotgalibaca sp. MA1X17-3]|uniref:N-acetylmuramoyl-L-alanine amidase n=1 Tax=Jeotgalibaca sp. MA1X17-3 TaxID=2908211 RepID=UPI001F3F75DA|nr:N-acetylmuramoyl-L-alanine amidase [Jeotgalibaca sp. MA1X17-3]UJF15051.1 N-acetylmuramoyl-L-alanine amidase [Jeotgalibaca sp. MA1X17-3]